MTRDQIKNRMIELLRRDGFPQKEHEKLTLELRTWEKKYLEVFNQIKTANDKSALKMLIEGLKDLALNIVITREVFESESGYENVVKTVQDHIDWIMEQRKSVESLIDGSSKTDDKISNQRWN